MNWTGAVFLTVGVVGLVACSGGDGDSDNDERDSPLFVEDEEHHASVYVLNHDTPGDVGHMAAVSFDQGRYYGPGKECTTRTEGYCTIRSCRSIPREDPRHPPVAFSAGTVMFSGANIPANSFARPNHETRYPYWHGPELIWTGGEDVRIAAQGDPQGVPSFEVTLKAPSLVRLSKPFWPKFESLPIDRSQDLEVAWQAVGAASGNVKVGLSGNEPSDTSLPFNSVDCNFPVSLGQAVIPASVLANLDAGDRGNVWIDVGEKRDVQAGPWTVGVQLRSQVQLQDGRFGLGEATIK